MKLLTARELAESLNVRYETVGDIIRCLGIVPEKHPHNGRAYGLTPEQCKAVRARLRPLSASQAVAS